MKRYRGIGGDDPQTYDFDYVDNLPAVDWFVEIWPEQDRRLIGDRWALRSPWPSLHVYEACTVVWSGVSKEAADDVRAEQARAMLSLSDEEAVQRNTIVG